MDSNYGLLSDLVYGLLFALQTNGRATRTCQYYQKLLEVFLNFARRQHWPQDPELITTNHIRQFLAWTNSRTGTYLAGRGTARSFRPRPSNAWPYFKAIRRLFNWGIEERLVTRNPAATIHYKTPPAVPVMAYSAAEIGAMMAACEQDSLSGNHFRGIRDRALLLLFLDAALRLKEAAGLSVADINFTDLTVRVTGKGSKTDYCPFSATAAAALSAYLRERQARARSSALWVTEAGYPVGLGGLSSAFRYLKKRAGVTSPGRTHRLRHTAALEYLRGAHDSFLLQLYLRHNDLTMSRRYTASLQKSEATAAHRAGASPVERLYHQLARESSEPADAGRQLEPGQKLLPPRVGPR